MNVMSNSIWNLNDWCNFYGALNSRNAIVAVEPEYSQPVTSITVPPLDTIGESARNRFGRPYISGRPLLACDRKKIIQMYASGSRKITIARAIGVTHSCVSKVIRRYEDEGFIDTKGSRTASCACPGDSEFHDPTVCRHVKFRNEQRGIELKSQLNVPNPKQSSKPFSINWILSDQCRSNVDNSGMFKAPTLNKNV